MSLRVLHVIDGLGTGGAERSLCELLPRLDAADISSVVVCLHQRDEGVQEAVRRHGVDVRILSGRHLVSRVTELRRIIEVVQPDVIHTTLYDASLVGRLGAIGSKASVVTSLVNIAYDPVRLLDPNVRTAPLRLAQAVDGITSRRLTHAFHAITEAVKRHAVTSMRIPPERIDVVPRGRDPLRLGVPGEERRRRARRALGLGVDDQVLVNVARQEHQKGQRHLLDAVSRLSSTHPRVVLVVAGRSGHASPGLALQAARPPLDRSVRFLGHRDDVPEILAAADVFVFPSLYEGLGGAVIEAMALGLPVVASDLEALREVVEDGASAVLVPAGSPDALAHAIAELLDQPERGRQLGARGRELFEQRFTLTRQAGLMIEMYRRIADAGNRSRR